MNRRDRLAGVVVGLFLLLLASSAYASCPPSSSPLPGTTRPDAQDDYYALPPSLPPQMELSVMDNDRPSSGALRLTWVGTPGNGSAVVTASGTILYRPSSIAPDAFTYSVTDDQGVSFATVHISVSPPSTVGFSYSCTGGNCTFTGTSNLPALKGFTYQFCPSPSGACTPTSPMVNGTYGNNFSNFGTYNATITASSYSGATVSNTQPINVVAQTVVINYTVDVSDGEWVSLSVSSITPASADNPLDANNQYKVDWGDGAGPVSIFQTGATHIAPQTVSHLYQSVGPRLIGVYFKQGNTTPQTFYRWFDVHNNPPVPTFTVINPSGDPRDHKRTFAVANFANPLGIDEQTRIYNSGGIWPDPWVWDFGDGTSVSTHNPDGVQHEYAHSGKFTVRLQTTDHLGVIGATTQDVTVLSNAPGADFAFDCTAGLTCNFTGSGSDDGWITQYGWNFGDNSAAVTSADPTTSHTFAAAGRYSVTLTNTDNDSLQGSRMRYVTVAAPDPSAGLAFFAVTPCRLFDSRANSGAALKDGSDTPLQVGGQCGVPVGAKVVTTSLAAITPTGDGYFKVYDPTKALPSGSLAFLGSTTGWATNVFAPLSADGRLTVRTVTGGPATKHLIVDVTGYFADWSSVPIAAPNGFARGPYALGFGAARYDSTLDSGATPLLPSTPQYFKLTNSLPAGASAAFLNLQIKDAPGAGYVTLYPSELPSKPAASTLNLTPHIPASNATIMALSGRTGDDVAMTYTGGGASTNYVLWAEAYFGTSAPYRYHPVTPCRAVDTRDRAAQGPGPGGPTTMGYQVGGNCGVPAGAAAVFAYVTYIRPDVRSNITVLNSMGGPDPFNPAIGFPMEILFAMANTTAGNGAIVTLKPSSVLHGDFLVTFGDPNDYGLMHGDLVVDVYGYFTPEATSPAGVSQ